MEVRERIPGCTCRISVSGEIIFGGYVGCPIHDPNAIKWQNTINYNQVIDNTPRPKDNITWLVMQDLASRAKRGVEKYNTTLEQNNTDDFLNHLYEELLDAAQYTKKEIETRKTIQQLILDSPNDNVLAAKVRETYGKTKTK